MKAAAILSSFTALLAASTAAVPYRVSVERVEQDTEGNVYHHVQDMISRYTAIEIAASDERTSKALQQVQSSDSLASFRSPRIDAERVPVQYNPSQVTFVGKVGLGTPPQYFRLAFEIGSADTWVATMGANCSDPAPCSPKRRFYNPHRSVTFESPPNERWSIGFSDKSMAMGFLHTDLVQAGGFVIDRQVIGTATDIAGFKENGVDGSFGLGMKSLSAHGDATPIENLISTKGMKSEVGVWLGSDNQGGEFTFGGSDPARFLGNLTYFDLPAGVVYWAVSVVSIAVVDTPLSPSHSPKNNGSETILTNTTVSYKQVMAKNDLGSKQPSAILDTSSNLILLPPRVATKVHQYIHNSFFGLYSGYSIFSGVYTVPCNLKKDVWIELGSSDTDRSNTQGNSSTNMFKVSARDIVRERASGIDGLFNTCLSGIQASKNDDDDWILGNIWFMNNYMTLDHRHRRVGIAPAVRLRE